MPRSRSRSSSVLADEALRLPRPPGLIRQFWARHHRVTDILIATACFLLSFVPAATVSTGTGSATPRAVAFSAVFPLLVIATCVLLVWRRRWPIQVFVASVIVAISCLFAAVPVACPLVLVTAYGLAVYRSSRTCWIGLGVALAALTTTAVTLGSIGLIPFHIVINAIAAESVLGLIGALIGVNVGNRRRYVEAIIDRSRQLLIERDQQGQLAAAGERARIAREMHDIVSHSLTVVVALDEGAAATPDRERARYAMDATAATARDALVEMRSMLGVLRDDDPDAPLSPLAPIAADVTVAAAQRAGYPVTLTVSGEQSTSQPVRYAVGRIVQEGLTNAMRHAPAASAISVSLAYTDDAVRIEVCNDGVVGVGRGGGFGIQGLHERAAAVGGTVRSTALSGGRWVLRAELPTGTGSLAPEAMR